MTQIGKSDLDVYPLCLGANTFGWTSAPEESFQVLDDYVAAGGNFIDTADVYSAWAPGNQGGESETIIGQWLAKRGGRDQLVIATKVAQLPTHKGLSSKSISGAVEDSLRRLGVDHIDLYYAHEQDDSTPVEESVAAFAKLVDEGKIREVGLSNFDPQGIAKWMQAADQQSVARPVALQPHYNLLMRREFESTLRPAAEEYDLGVMTYFSLASGLLTGKYQPGQPVSGARAGMVEAYLSPRAETVIAALEEIAAEHNVEPAAIAVAWLLQQPTVTAPIASARVASQLPALLEGVSLVLGSHELERLDQLSAGLPDAK